MLKTTATVDFWNDRLRLALQQYNEDLLRKVASNLCKPRSFWPVGELVDRCLATTGNPVTLDRRLQALTPVSRSVLALIATSLQPRWRIGCLVELAVALGAEDGFSEIVRLLEGGLLFPYPQGEGQEGSIADLSVDVFSSGVEGDLFAHPAVLERAGEHTEVIDPPGFDVGRMCRQIDKPAVQEADGLEWPLRLASLWQEVHAAPLRRTQNGDFFKRDLDRLRSNAVLNATASSDTVREVPDAAPFAVVLAANSGLLAGTDSEWKANDFPESWQQGLPDTIRSLWQALWLIESWNAAEGWLREPGEHNPHLSAYLLGMTLLARVPDGSWIATEQIEEWVCAHHPYWAQTRNSKPESTGVASFLGGIGFQLRLLDLTRDGDESLVRLSALGRYMLGLSEKPPLIPSFPQTLLVQPNLQILAYRQGLTPALIERLSQVATWTGVGPACTLQLDPDSVYRALESGETFESILQLFERHGMKETPAAVVDSLRTWSNKRERISVYPAAALFEFSSEEELKEALARGLPGVRLTERLAAVPNESLIDYKHFRLKATRDYALPPERCVDVEEDGVTLRVDLARADLLLETELESFAERLPQGDEDGRRLYRITPSSLQAGRENGLSEQFLDTWFEQRCGDSISPATKLLLSGAETEPFKLQKLLVVTVARSDIADGLLQWPQTRGLIESRLGTTALVVREESVKALQELLAQLGIEVEEATTEVPTE